jgi:hypothetical protein
MKNKIYIIVMLTLMVSCEKRNSISEILIAKPNEAWVTYDSEPDAFFTSYKFGQDGFCTRIERDSANKFYIYKGGGDLEISPEKWNVTDDSILKWGMNVFDVVSYNDDIIVLYFISDINRRNNGMVFLIKEKENNPRKYSNYFSKKRVDHPEKYKLDKPRGYYCKGCRIQ